MLTLCIESIATVDGDGHVFSSYPNVSEELVTRCPPRYHGEPIDGIVHIYCPDLTCEDGEPLRAGAWAFRDASKGGYDPETPILEWTNPDDPVEDLTLGQPMETAVGDVTEGFWVSDGYVVPVQYAES